jgi:hypothetical protein
MSDKGRAAMQQIADWLKKLGMSEYVELFAENRINISALRYLTDQDLKDIGIPLGHRRIMQAAISELAGAAPEPTARKEPKPQDTAARQQELRLGLPLWELLLGRMSECLSHRPSRWTSECRRRSLSRRVSERLPRARSPPLQAQR